MVHTLFQWVRQFVVALRIFSLTLAFAATSTGMIAAFRMGYMEKPFSWMNLLLVALVTIAGLASQAGANLINDFFEGSFKYKDPSNRSFKIGKMERSGFDVFVFFAGLAALCLAALIGLYLVYISGWIMLVIGLTGIIGSYAYTGEPFVYKRKGLGVILSFLLMGPLMTLGAWYPFAKTLSWYPVLLGMPVSMLVPALMISNEMRDFKRDKRLSMGTLSTLLGPRWSLRLYEILVFGSFALTLVYVILDFYPWQTLAVAPLLAVAFKARSCVSRFERLSIPWTNRIHLGFTVVTVVVLILW